MATDAEVKAAGLYAVPQSRFLRNNFQLPIEEAVEETESFGIPQTQAFTNSDGNFNSFSNNPYTANLTPDGYKNFRTEYNNTGYLPGKEPKPNRFAPAMNLIKTGIGMAIPGGNFLMGMAGKLDRFKNLSAQDKAFAEMQMAGQEQNIHGGNLSNQDRYGHNKRSSLGNYADVVSEYSKAASLKDEEDLTDFDRYYLEKQKEQDFSYQQSLKNDRRQTNLTANKIRESRSYKNNVDTPRGPTQPDPTPTPTKAQDNPDRGRGQQDIESQTNSQQGPAYDFAKGGRAGYFFGGRVNYKVGGRTDAGANRSTASKAGVGQINEAGQQVNNSGNDGGNDKPTFYSPPDNKTITTDLISKSPELNINYTDPRNFASLKSKIGFKDILDNDDITAAGNVTGGYDNYGYDIPFTEQGIKGVDLTAGNFNANIDANKNLKNIQYNRGPLSVGYSGDGNYFAKLGINYKNGGLASIL